jgi:ribosomal protein S27AE
MSTLDTVLGLLGKWPAWKRITAAPDEIAALRQRVELLEAALRTRGQQRDECPKCHALTWRMTGNRPDAHFGSMGVSYDRWACSSCAYTREIEAK